MAAGAGDAAPKAPGKPDALGLTPLHYQAAFGRLKHARALLEAGAPLDAAAGDVPGLHQLHEHAPSCPV